MAWGHILPKPKKENSRNVGDWRIIALDTNLVDTETLVLLSVSHVLGGSFSQLVLKEFSPKKIMPRFVQS